MKSQGGLPAWDYADRAWQRLALVIPAAIVLWAALMVAFTGLLKRVTVAPVAPPVKMNFVELPPSVPARPHPAPAVRPHVIPPKPRPRARVRRSPAPPVSHVTAKPLPKPLPPATAAARPVPEPEAKAPAAPAISGAASESGGARAVYAPKPVIPDDLRDQGFSAVAIAHFEVGSDGSVKVTLARPTDSPELNQILLETLRQWRFFPAMKNGVTINSQFDLRIPISVQ